MCKAINLVSKRVSMLKPFYLDRLFKDYKWAWLGQKVLRPPLPQNSGSTPGHAIGILNCLLITLNLLRLNLVTKCPPTSSFGGSSFGGKKRG